MYKVLIVDDEPIHRRGLTNMIRELRPGFYVNSAKNGAEALDYVRHHQVDILITDIKMPVMDGLKLIESLGEKTKEIKIIILSVYGYFEYAQKAINLGAIEYVLKPVDRDRIDAVLNKAEQRIAEEANEKREKANLKNKLECTLPEYLEHKMNKLLLSRLNCNEFNEIYSLFSCGKKGAVMVFELNYEEQKSNDSFDSIKNHIKETMNLFCKSVIFSLNDGSDNIACILELQGDEIDCLDRLHELIYKIKASYGMDMNIGIGSIYNSLQYDAKDSFKNAKTALKYRFYKGYGNILMYSDINKNQEKITVRDSDKQELKNSLIKHDRDRVRQVTDRILNDIAKDGSTDPEQLLRYAGDFMKEQIQSIKTQYKYSVMDRYDQDISTEIMGCRSFEELRKLMLLTVSEISDALDERKNCINSSVIEMSKKYIEEHYMEDISLDSIAGVFFFNASYFSNLFKSETNICFCDYLQRVRMDKAKELLMSNKYKVYEVANLVGYQDSKYFNRIFKKEFGATPDEYRRLSKMGDMGA